MKLKVAVVLGPEGVGKSWALKKFARSIQKRITGMSVEREWNKNGEANIDDIKDKNGKTLDFVLVGESNGKKIVILTEGDFVFEPLYLAKIINLKFLGEIQGHEDKESEILVFCACRWEASTAKARGLELEEFPSPEEVSSKKRTLWDGTLRIVPLEWKKGETTTKVDEDSVKGVSSKLKVIFDEWTGLKDTSGQGSGKDTH